MPGTPPQSPNFGSPRYADSDPASFSLQVNDIVDTFDAEAVRVNDTRLTDQRTPIDASVITQKIADGAVTAPKIAARTITAQQIATGTITSNEIADGSVATADLAANAVTTGKIAAGAVTTAAIADGNVTLAKLDATTQQQSLFATGDLKMTFATTPPAGWLMCNGGAISRTTYANLFTLLGTTYGAGDGSTTFNLPDLRGRALIGAGTGAGLTARALGARGGEETHVLTAAELASHSHTVSDPGHVHGISDPGHAHSISDPTHTHGLGQGVWAASGDTAAGGSTGTVAGGTGVNVRWYRTAATAAGTGIGIYSATTGISIAAHATGISLAATGSNSAHNNMPPFCAVNYMIKT